MLPLFHRRSMVKMATPGFGYGFIVAWAFVLSFLTLMCGLILEGFNDTVTTELEKSEDAFPKDVWGVLAGLLLNYFWALVGLSNHLQVFQE